MVALAAFLFAFHLILKAYVLPTLTGHVACRNAALGEYVPADPPLSFQPTSWSPPLLTLTKMPMSWLKPELAVHRSTLADTRAVPVPVGARAAVRLAASIGCPAPPPLSANSYFFLVPPSTPLASRTNTT